MAGYRGGFGGFGGGNQMQNLMKQAQKMQEDMQRSKEEIENSTFTATAGGGMVEVVLSGKKRIEKVTLKPEVVDPDDIEMLEDLILAAVNDAIAQVEKMEAEKLPSVPGM